MSVGAWGNPAPSDTATKPKVWEPLPRPAITKPAKGYELVKPLSAEKKFLFRLMGGLERCEAEAILYALNGRLRSISRHVAGVYGRPQDFPDEESYLVALTIVLDDLCDTLIMPKFTEENAPWLDA